MKPEAVDVDRPVDDADLAPVPDVVVPRHPEGAVVFVGEIHSLLDSRMLVPQLALVAPFALPFPAAPGVPDLDEPEGSAATHHVAHHATGCDPPHVQDAVGVPLVQPVDPAGARGAEDALQGVVLPQDLEHLLVVDDLTPGLQGACPLVT
eukprot:CAMPEP_0171267872 /NCGR_PEP_ID=MMETSP0790-20130122/59379_1 /TAXON_ID=2925 /ORGANISM="Alexandrium catenella, Strain OF101" /LENGTH=149 /DNA_ID=CAMNT_0011736615 /DNA_START=121 /DNA_END=566 /DNA_ORIENTATION=-